MIAIMKIQHWYSVFHFVIIWLTVRSVTFNSSSSIIRVEEKKKLSIENLLSNKYKYMHWALRIRLHSFLAVIFHVESDTIRNQKQEPCQHTEARRCYRPNVSRANNNKFILSNHVFELSGLKWPNAHSNMIYSFLYSLRAHSQAASISSLMLSVHFVDGAQLQRHPAHLSLFSLHWIGYSYFNQSYANGTREEKIEWCPELHAHLVSDSDSMLHTAYSYAAVRFPVQNGSEYSFEYCENMPIDIYMHK